MSAPKRIIVSVTNDLFTDQRVAKVCNTLHAEGYKIMLVGRKLANSKAINRSYPTYRFKLPINKGVLFYFLFNLRLFIYLIRNKADLVYANDLDTLLANYLASRFKRIPLIYDSHEYFIEVPELINRPLKKKLWEVLEEFCLKNIKYAFTVSEGIAEAYQKKYSIRFRLLRNFPLLRDQEKPNKKPFLIYQGALNVGRGLEELISAMQYVKEGYHLKIAGDGDIKEKLIQLVKNSKLEEKVEFLGRLAPEELRRITQQAQLGFSIEKELGLNYRYALPNKVFDYLHAGTPILYSDLIEVKNLLKNDKVGEELNSYSPQEMAQQINEMLSSEKLFEWQQNCLKAAQKLNWQTESKVLMATIKEAHG